MLKTIIPGAKHHGRGSLEETASISSNFLDTEECKTCICSFTYTELKYMKTKPILLLKIYQSKARSTGYETETHRLSVTFRRPNEQAGSRCGIQSNLVLWALLQLEYKD